MSLFEQMIVIYDFIRTRRHIGRIAGLDAQLPIGAIHAPLWKRLDDRPNVGKRHCHGHTNLFSLDTGVFAVVFYRLPFPAGPLALKLASHLGRVNSAGYLGATRAVFHTVVLL